MRTLRRVLLTIVVFLLSVSNSFASISVRVDEIGIKGWTSNSVAPLRFTIENSGQPVILKLRIEIDRKSWYGSPQDVYDETLTIPSGTTQYLRPLLISALQEADVTLFDESNQVVAHGDTKRLVRSAIRGHLVVVYAHDPALYAEIKEKAAQSDQAEIKIRKERELDFVKVGTIEDRPWYYSQADMIIIAEPLLASAEQKRALEDYVRSGGRLLVTPLTAASTGLDSVYLHEEGFAAVGRGTVYDVSATFASNTFTRATGEAMAYARTPSTILELVSWRMAFPAMKSAILITILYILLIGVVNFTILRRLGKLEFGWITIPAIALLFAAGVYLVSLTRGIDQVRLDEATTYYLDNHSPKAYVRDGIRVTAPAFGHFVLQLASGATFSDRMNSLGRDRLLIGEAVVGEGKSEFKSWHFTRNQNISAVDLELRRWSFDEWSSDRYEDMPGTVTLDDTTVRNSTGVKFKSAILIDSSDRRLYPLGEIDKNAFVQLGPSRPIPQVNWERTARSSGVGEISTSDLVGLSPGGRCFIGLVDDSERNGPSASIAGRPFKHVQTRVYVVVLE